MQGKIRMDTLFKGDINEAQKIIWNQMQME